MRNFLVFLAGITSPAFAQSSDSAKSDSGSPIQDNSFFVEEAYNQEAGVVQHVTTFHRYRGSSDFELGFGQEWPVRSVRHQLSFDIPLTRTASKTGVGDIGVNYRYQVYGDATTPLALAPRLTVLLPTGDWKKSHGTGTVGFEVNLPLSYVVSRYVVTHFNAGAAITPSARNAFGDRATVGEWGGSASAIFTGSNAIQPMVEAVFSRAQEVVGDNRTTYGNSTFVAPGLRGAINFDSGVQLVPGISFPIGVGGSSGERSAFFYLSVEHAFSR